MYRRHSTGPPDSISASQAQTANQPGTLPGGSSGTLVIQARFTVGTTANGFTATNQATISSSSATTVTSNAVTTTAVAVDKATFAKTRLSSNSTKGQETAYKIDLCQPAGSNIGGLNTTGLTLAELVPTGASYVAGSASNGGVFTPGHPGQDRVGRAQPHRRRGRRLLSPEPFRSSTPAGLRDSVTNIAQATYTPAGAIRQDRRWVLRPTVS